MAHAETEIALGPFRVDLAGIRLLRDGVPLELRPQAFRALEVLIRNHGRLVDYGQMIREAWGVQVSKHTVATTVNEVKSVLGDYGSWITCQPKFGYRLTMRHSEDLLRRGWHFSNQYTRVGFENALQCFQQAAENDSSDFRAFEAISSMCLMLAGFLMRAPRDCHAIFLEAHRRAVALCGMTPELRLDRAFGLFIFEQNLEEAEAELIAVRRERPSLVHAHIWLALLYLASGRLDEARNAMLEAKAVDELEPQLAILGTIVPLFRREFRAAEEWGKQNLDLHPSSQVGRAFYAEALERTDQFEEALAQYRMAIALSPEALWIRADEGGCLARHGHSAAAMAILEDLRRIRRTAYVDAYHVALLLDALGRRNEAFQELERAHEERAYSLLYIGVDAKADAIRSDPRFARFGQKAFPIRASFSNGAS
jgi:DNA-binding winged helix-turn-helix (wHTH) protein/Flp pilus assembly protein TadD